MLAEWVWLGATLKEACPERFAEVVDALRSVVGAQSMIAAHDDQLILRAERPKKRYEA